MTGRRGGLFSAAGDTKGEEYGGMDFWKASGRRRTIRVFDRWRRRPTPRRAKSRKCRGCWRFANRRSRYSHAIVSQRERGGRARSRIDEGGGEKKVKSRGGGREEGAFLDVVPSLLPLFRFERSKASVSSGGPCVLSLNLGSMLGTIGRGFKRRARLIGE